MKDTKVRLYCQQFLKLNKFFKKVFCFVTMQILDNKNVP